MQLTELSGHALVEVHILKNSVNQPMGDKNLQNPSLLLMRHLDEFRFSSPLLVGYPDDNFGLLLQQERPQASLTLFSSDYSAHRRVRERWSAARLNIKRLIFGPWYTPPDGQHDAAMVYLPKSRSLIEMTLTMIVGAVSPGAPVYLVGENNAGIRSSRRALESIVGDVSSSDAARHCVLYRSAVSDKALERTRLNDWLESFIVEVRGLELELKSLPGVFSHGRLDAGTRFFLENLELPPSARVLDFGCGSGVIGLTAKLLQPNTSVDMVDTSALAVESARQTMASNNFPQEKIWASDVFSDVKGSYNRILSNPPFHTGVHTDYRVVEEFFREAARHLTKGGSLCIVANRFLKYPPLMEKHIGSCRVVAENNNYRVYEARRM